MAIAAPQWGVVMLGGTPTSVTAGASSLNVAIPNAADGKPARFVWLQMASGNAMVRLGQDDTVTVTNGATGNGVLVGANSGIVIPTRGARYLAYIQQGTGGLLNIVPVEV